MLGRVIRVRVRVLVVLADRRVGFLVVLAGRRIGFLVVLAGRRIGFSGRRGPWVSVSFWESGFWGAG